MAKRKIIIDTDPGQDDAVAILLALASPELEVLGVVAVAGNVPLALTEVNARKVCELAGRPDIKVYAGCSRPLLRPLHTAEEVHGKTGLDGPDLAEPTMPLQEQHGVDWMIDTLLAAQDSSITVCMLGPMTNLGMALAKAPEIRSKIREVVAMGGGFFEGGNATPSAEFNIFVDPHAAAAVFESDIPIVLAPLDVTHSALMNHDWIESLRRLPGRVGPAVADMLDFYERFDMERYGEDGGPLHDPCVIAYLLDPDLFGGRQCAVRIETQSDLTMGATVVDWWLQTDHPRNCFYLRTIDRDGFYKLIRDRLATLESATA